MNRLVRGISGRFIWKADTLIKTEFTGSNFFPLPVRFIPFSPPGHFQDEIPYLYHNIYQHNKPDVDDYDKENEL